MGLIVFDGCSYEGERVAIEASKIVAAVSALPEEGQTGPRTVIMFRSGETDHRAVVRHRVDEVADAVSRVSIF